MMENKFTPRAEEALRLAQHKLPIKTRIITKEVETEIGGE